jgi:hypothetical protein
VQTIRIYEIYFGHLDAEEIKMRAEILWRENSLIACIRKPEK